MGTNKRYCLKRNNKICNIQEERDKQTRKERRQMKLLNCKKTLLMSKNPLNFVKISSNGYNYSTMMLMLKAVSQTMGTCLTDFLFCEVFAMNVPFPLTSS